MANQLSLTVGTNTVTVPIKLTNAKTNAVLLRYCIAKGIVTEGKSTQEIGEEVLRSLLRYVRDVSLDRQRMELLAEQHLQLESMLTSDNELFSE